MEIKLSQFYNVDIVETASELFYIIELGKYLSKTGDVLSLEGVKLVSHLEKSRFWDYLKVAVYNKWLTGLGVSPMWLNLEGSLNSLRQASRLRNIGVFETDSENTVVPSDSKRSDLVYDVVTPVPLPVIFNKLSDNAHWVWSMKDQGSLCANYFDPVSQNIVSIIAYVAVRKFKTGLPRTLHLDLSDLRFQQTFGAVDIDVLDDMTNTFTGWLTYELSDDISHKANRGYESWYYMGIERGLLAAHGMYDAEEKRNHFLSLGFKVGDVIGYYTRNARQTNIMKSVSEFHYAIVRRISNMSLQLELIFTRETPYMHKKKYDNLSMSLKNLNPTPPAFDKFNSRLLTVSWYDIGVEYFMYDELTFVAPIYHVDGDYNCIPIAMSETDSWLLPQEQAVYWLLKVYGVDFNEEHYRQEHFGDNIPFYDSYISGISEK